MTRAVEIPQPGGPEVLRVAEREVRDPRAGEVRIAMRAAAVNPTDIGLRQRGAPGLDPPWVPGMDAAGVVESVGAGVERLAVGDRVMAAVMPRRPEGGAQAELVVVPATSVVAAPVGRSIEQAATLPMNGLTAMRGLELLALEPGATLAVTGGAGLLASYVIPLAKRQGLHVLADAKPEDEELVRSFGADDVLPRGDGLVAALRAQAPGGVDAVYDTALLGRAVLPAIREGGAFAFVRTWDGEDVEQGVHVRRVQIADVIERTGWLEELAALTAEGLLDLRVAETFPPEQVADAHRLMERGGLRGRALIIFD
jgi:NADPH:quinone reductase-like Zn-dependent oxidoreductase